MALLEWESGGATVALEFDVTSTQGSEFTAEVSEHPVETGAAITDHVRPNNPSFTLEALISNTPIAVPTTQTQGATRSLQNVEIVVDGQRLQASLYQWSSPLERVRVCEDLLESLVQSGTVVRLTTGTRVVEGLVITRKSVTRTAQTGGALPVVMEFKKLRIASVQRVTVPLVRRGQLLDSRGPQPAVPNNSLLHNLIHGAP